MAEFFTIKIKFLVMVDKIIFVKQYWIYQNLFTIFYFILVCEFFLFGIFSPNHFKIWNGYIVSNLSL